MSDPSPAREAEQRRLQRGRVKDLVIAELTRACLIRERDALQGNLIAHGPTRAYELRAHSDPSNPSNREVSLPLFLVVERVIEARAAEGLQLPPEITQRIAFPSLTFRAAPDDLKHDVNYLVGVSATLATLRAMPFSPAAYAFARENNITPKRLDEQLSARHARVESIKNALTAAVNDASAAPTPRTLDEFFAAKERVVRMAMLAVIQELEALQKRGPAGEAFRAARHRMRNVVYQAVAALEKDGFVRRFELREVARVAFTAAGWARYVWPQLKRELPWADLAEGAADE